jgi:dTDP-4-amino-4,6-dideoxygalactose transaminase
MSSDRFAADNAAPPVPPLNLAASFAALREPLLREIAEVCESGQYILGTKVAAFERALAEYCGSRYALGVSSGTDAQLLGMMALGIGRGDEVIVPALTFFATAGTVARLGARPVFCDIDPHTFNLDAGQLEDRITTRTKAVAPVHLYGQMVDLKPIFEACNRRGIAVIEDAAQAIGARPPGASHGSAGSYGTFGWLSFYPTKNLGAFGDAGALLTNDARLHELFVKLRVHGSGHTYYHERVGGNFRIDALQAAILSVKLPYLEGWIEARRQRAARYTQWIEQAGLAPEHVRPPREVYGRHIYHQYVVRVQRRDELVEFLRARQIGCGVYYPVPLHLQRCFEYLGYKSGDFPQAEHAAAEVLALPLYPELTADQQQAVVAALAAFYAR